MSVNIKNREVEALLGEIKAATGKGTSRIVLELVRKEVARLRKEREVARRRRDIEALTLRYSARLPDRRSPQEAAIDYDEDGLPN